jgi:hypothetical protein
MVPSDKTMSTQPLKMSTRDFSWGKGGRCVRLTIYHPCSAETSRESGTLTNPEPLGPPRPVAGHFYFFLWGGFNQGFPVIKKKSISPAPHPWLSFTEHLQNAGKIH